MKNAIPPGFEMACFPVPRVEGGQGDPNAVYAGGGENFVAFADAKHPREALDFLKYMVSKESARSYIQQLDTLSPVQGSAQGLKLSSGLQSAVDVLSKSTRLYSDRISGLYLEFAKNAEPDLLADLLSGKITPEQFGARLESAIDQVRRNPEIYKPAPMGVPNE